MKVPYKGKFKITQEFKGSEHDGFDMVGIDDKTIYSPIDGVVEYAGWENAGNHNKGFGLYVRIKQNNSPDRYYFGHLSKISVKINQKISKGAVIGTEGNTGYSTGSHLHYCVRKDAKKSKIRDISDITELPNKEGEYTKNPYDGVWVKDSFGWWYSYDFGGYPKNQWLMLDAWYYFDDSGYALQNTTIEYKGKIYKFGNDCRCINP